MNVESLSAINGIRSWGSQGKEGVTMPGKGRTRPARERDPQAPADALDIFLNAQAFWANVPQAVWDFTIGGYQVMKKWLSYREQRVLGRALTVAEITEVTHMARRLTALVALQPALDAIYHKCHTHTYTPPPA